jgi:hypothetical protein
MLIMLKTSTAKCIVVMTGNHAQTWKIIPCLLGHEQWLASIADLGNKTPQDTQAYYA